MMTKLQLKSRFGVKYLREVYIDDRLWGVLPVKLLKSYLDLEEMDNEQFKYIEDLLYRYARERLFNYLAKSEHSEYESRQFLRKLSFKSSLIDKVVDFCLDRNFISDKRLAELFVRSMIELGKSKIDISYKLKQKGLDTALVEEELNKQYNYEVKQQVLEQSVENAVRRFAYQDQDNIFDKCCNYLIRKGFKYSEFGELLKKHFR
jgi:SOS response regulatory protein OraA/RecX